MLKTGALNGSFKTKKHVILELLEPQAMDSEHTTELKTVAPLPPMILHSYRIYSWYVVLSGLHFGIHIYSLLELHPKPLNPKACVPRKNFSHPDFGTEFDNGSWQLVCK